MFDLDNRGSATATANFFLALVAGAVLSWIIREITAPIISRSESAAAGDPVGTEAVAYSEAFLGYQPVLFLFAAFFSYIALSVFQRQYAGY